MLAYFLRRLLLMVPTLFGITVVTFGVMQLAPGEPAVIQQMQESGMTGSTVDLSRNVERFRKMYHLDRPVLVQYGYWLGRLLRLDFGDSLIDQRPVIARIRARIWNTLQINLIAFAISWALAVPLGIASAVWRRSAFDNVSTLVVFVLYSLPTFWVALLLIMLFGVHLGWLPFYGKESFGMEHASWMAWTWDRLQHMTLIVVCLTYPSLAALSRYARGAMLDVYNQDYVRTARAKGLPEGVVVLKHALRASLLPLVTLFGFLLPALIGGSVILEYIFSWPGLGALYFNAILQRDYPLVMGLSFISAVLVLIGNLLADVLYAVVDPRISYS